ncbi:TPA: hypothetical protein NNT20_004876 [Salmonella enterica]|nr:hypothetical protein [Salmonella enterica]
MKTGLTIISVLVSSLASQSVYAINAANNINQGVGNNIAGQHYVIGDNNTVTNNTGDNVIYGDRNVVDNGDTVIVGQVNHVSGFWGATVGDVNNITATEGAQNNTFGMSIL